MTSHNKALYIVAHTKCLMFHCVYNYFIGNRRKRSDITDNNKPGSCPSTTVGTCVEACNSDNSCQGDQKCCSNGCGHVCTNPVHGEYYYIVYRNLFLIRFTSSYNSMTYVVMVFCHIEICL